MPFLLYGAIIGHLFSIVSALGELLVILEETMSLAPCHDSGNETNLVAVYIKECLTLWHVGSFPRNLFLRIIFALGF